MSRFFSALPARYLAASVACLVALAAQAANPRASQPEASPPPLSLRAALSRSLASNPDLAALPFGLEAQAAKRTAAGLAPSPELQVQLENLLGTGRLQGFSGAEATVAVSQLLEPAQLRAQRVAVASAEAEGLRIEQQIRLLDTAAETRRRFVHVLEDQHDLALAEHGLQLAQKTLREVQRRVEAARAPIAELHRARIRLARAEVATEHAEHELLSARRQLSALWGAQAPDFGKADADLFALPELTGVDALSDRLSTRPDAQRFASRARVADAEQRLAAAKARAPLTVSAGLRRVQASRDFAFVGSVSLPLFASRAAQPAERVAIAERQQAEALGRAEQQRAEAALFSLVQELRHAITEAEMLRDRVLPEMDAALKATEYAWQRGRYSTLEWTEAQTERLALEAALIAAAANAHRHHIEIERLTAALATEPAP